MTDVFLTQKGYEQLREELEFLKTTKRREIAQAIAKARAMGDLSENAEYDAAKEAQGQGYGDMLLSFIMDKAREHGALNMFLEVRVSNKVAISLYEKKGFNEMAIRPRYYPAENGREDAMLMGAAL